MKNKDRYNLSELTVSKDSLVPILRVYQGRDLETRKEIATIRRYGGKRIDSILDWLEQDYSPLTESERAYLRAVIKPWRDRITFINKRSYREQEYVGIALEDSDYIALPYFKTGTMYQGMELYKKYSLEDLGL